MTIKEQFQQVVSAPDSSVLITNHRDTNRRDYRHYYLRVTMDGMQLKEESMTLRRDYTYSFTDDSLEMDGIKKGQDFVDEFYDKLAKIAKDVEANQAFVFEHKPEQSETDK
ncbi:MAG: hypothetical protein O3A01_00485 [bacterium]|nr:hypothetical protein [bacterium]